MTGPLRQPCHSPPRHTPLVHGPRSPLAAHCPSRPSAPRNDDMSKSGSGNPCSECRKPALDSRAPRVSVMRRSPDVVVVGAGVVGAACAYELAAAGARVRLLRALVRRLRQLRRLRGQRARLGQGARARAAAGAALGRAVGAARRTSSPDDFEYDRKGSVVVAETEAELIAATERARVLAGLGVEGEVLDARRAAPGGAARGARPARRRALPRRRAARAAAGHRRARARRRRPRRRADHRRAGRPDRARHRRARHRRRDQRRA